MDVVAGWAPDPVSHMLGDRKSRIVELLFSRPRGDEL